MRARLRIIGLAAGLAALTIAPAPAATLSLFNALAVAYETNPQLDSARAALAALDQGVAQADAGWRPNVSITGSYGLQRDSVQGIAAPYNSHPLIGQVTISEPLFRGGRTLAEVRHAVALVLAGRAQLTAIEQSVLLSAVTVYADVVRDMSIAESNAANVRSLESELKAVQTELAEGDVTRTDALQVEARLARARSDLAVAEQHLAASRAAFENTIGRPAETLDVAEPLPQLPTTSNVALAVALQRNPILLQARATVKAADYAVDDAVGALLPEVSMAAQYQYLRDAAGANIFASNSPQQVLSVLGQVTVPIYQGGGDEAGVRRAKDLRHKSQFDLVQTERDLRQEVASAWDALHQQKLALAASDAEVRADDAALDGVEKERRAGQRTELDVLNAQQEYIGARISVASAQHDYLVAAYRLVAATGQLTAKALRLGVKLYDPTAHYDEDAHAWFGFGE